MSAETFIKNGENALIYDTPLHRGLRGLIAENKTELVKALEGNTPITEWIYLRLLIQTASFAASVEQNTRLKNPQSIQKKLQELIDKERKYVESLTLPQITKKKPNWKSFSKTIQELQKQSKKLESILKENSEKEVKTKKIDIENTMMLWKKRWLLWNQNRTPTNNKPFTLDDMLKNFSYKGGEVEELLPNSSKYGVAIELFSLKNDMYQPNLSPGYNLTNGIPLNYSESQSISKMLRSLGIVGDMLMHTSFWDLTPTKIKGLWLQLRPKGSNTIRVTLLCDSSFLETTFAALPAVKLSE